jgi:hypothetical protein
METKGEKKTYKDCCKRFSNFLLKIFESKLYYHLIIQWTVINTIISITIYYLYFHDHPEYDVYGVQATIFISPVELFLTYFCIHDYEQDWKVDISPKLRIIGLITSLKLYFIFIPMYYQIYYLVWLVAVEDVILFILYKICNYVKSFVKECKHIYTNSSLEV